MRLIEASHRKRHLASVGKTHQSAVETVWKLIVSFSPRFSLGQEATFQSLTVSTVFHLDLQSAEGLEVIWKPLKRLLTIWHALIPTLKRGENERS
jgi:hypothetical protein